jgi:uncharacterized membrane protein YqaE (UPF0057 family)
MADEINLPRSNTSRVGIKFWIIVQANIIGYTILAILVWIASKIGGDFHLNLLICLLGFIIGWILGTLASPYSKTESTQFLSLSQAISAFISGYLISKLDRFLEVTLFTKVGEVQNHAWIRAGLFAAS